MKTRGMHEGMQAERQMNRAVKCLHRCVLYSARYGMRLEQAQGHILLAWLQQTKEGTHQSAIAIKHIKSAKDCLEQTQGENYTQQQLDHMIQAMKNEEKQQTTVQAQRSSVVV